MAKDATANVGVETAETGGLELFVDERLLDDPADTFEVGSAEPLQIQAVQYGVDAATILRWNLDDQEMDSEPDDEQERTAEQQAHRPRAVGQSNSNAIDLADLSTRDQDVETMLTAFEHGWLEGINKLLAHEITTCNFSANRLGVIRQQIYYMFITMDNTIFQSHARGDMDYRYIHDPETRQALNKNWNRAMQTGQPAIYRNSLVSADGHSPSPIQLLSILGVIEQYTARGKGR
ncbi:hypothetical protein LTR53_004768 [Teratosphaeriaceae sp. CCFEE 6253]|nr:hypothetical protein LTR53_004768 [Teratosphaeriaceae sp. CCFEE 6253]